MCSKRKWRKGAFKAVLHCFTSQEWLAHKGVELGLYVSFSGILTYKTAENLRDAARNLPEDRILVETDSPYLAPVPHRGKSNEPAFVVKTLEHARCRRAALTLTIWRRPRVTTSSGCSARCRDPGRFA